MTAPVSLLAELASMARPGSEDEELREIRLPRFAEADQVAQQIVLLEEPLRIKAEGRLSEAAQAFMRRHWDYDETWQQGITHLEPSHDDPVELLLALTLSGIDAGYYIGVAVGLGWRSSFAWYRSSRTRKARRDGEGRIPETSGWVDHNTRGVVLSCWPSVRQI